MIEFILISILIIALIVLNLTVKIRNLEDDLAKKVNNIEYLQNKLETRILRLENPPVDILATQILNEKDYTGVSALDSMSEQRNK